MNTKRYFLLSATILLLTAMAQAQPATDSARPQPGYLGAIFPDKATAADRGVKIIDLVPGGPAEKAGLKVDDVITAINGHEIHSASDLGATLKPLGPGSKPTFEVDRAGGKQQVAVTLGDRPAPNDRAAPGERPSAPGEGPRDTLPPPSERGGNFPNGNLPNINVSGGPDSRPSADGSRRAILGVRTQPVSEEARRRLGLDSTLGALVTSRSPDSPASRAGLPVNSAIVSLDGRRINSPDDLAAAVAQAGVGKEVDIGFVQNGRTSHVKAQLASAASVGPEAAMQRPLLGPDAAGQRPILSQIPRILSQVGGASEDRARIQELEQRVQQLEQRLNALENGGNRPTARGPAPGGIAPAPLP